MSNVKLYLSDCLEFMRTLESGSVDCVITDPPYGLDIDYGETYEDSQDNLRKLIAQFLPESQRVANRVIVSSGISNAFLYPAPTWISACAWNTTGSYGKYGVNQWFPLLCYGKDISGFGSINGMIKGDLITVSGGGSVGFQRDNKENNHPCPKPLNLIEKMVRRFTNEGDTVFDPFTGSGTTAVACVKLGRNFIGCEINPDYYKTAQERIAQAQAEMGETDRPIKNGLVQVRAFT